MAQPGEGQIRNLVRGPAADLWRHTLLRIPTVFGRLVYLASLRDQNTGLYRHHGLSQMFGEAEADQTLRQSHSQVFSEWLSLDLEYQKSQVSAYLADLEESAAVVVANWTRLASYRNFVPADARQAEQELYISDLETMLYLFRGEYGVACHDPDA